MVRFITCPVPAFVIVTFAPLTTAPEGSVTVPTMLPVPTVVCANALGSSSERITAAYTIQLNRLMVERLSDIRLPSFQIAE